MIPISGAYAVSSPSQKNVRQFNSPNSVSVNIRVADISFVQTKEQIAKITFSGDPRYILIENKNNDIKISETKLAYKGKAMKVTLTIHVPQTVSGIGVNIGKGDVVFRDRTVADIDIAGGAVVFTGNDILGKMNFRFGSGKINLLYSTKELKNPLELKVAGGSLEIRAILSSAFRSICNSAWSQSLELKSDLPVVDKSKKQEADFVISGTFGKATVIIESKTPKKSVYNKNS
jgi:hypothetical protein